MFSMIFSKLKIICEELAFCTSSLFFNNEKLVKPFVLVVCKDINHAKNVYDYINSPSFYNGQYMGKVLQIDSSTKKDLEFPAKTPGVSDKNSKPK